MPTPIFICGAECGLATVGTLGVGVEHWSSVVGTTTVETAPASRGGNAYRFAGGGASRTLTHTFATAVASPATVVARFYIYFATLPAATTNVFYVTGSGGGGRCVTFVASDNTLRAGTSTIAFASSGYTVTTGQWYRVDYKAVFNTTTTIDIQVDGNAQTQYSVGSSAQTAVSATLGHDVGTTADIYIDDLVVSGTSGDYPIGAGRVAGLYPNGDGTHAYNAATDFQKGGTANTALATPSSAETTTWVDLKTPLSTTVDTANFVQAVNNATDGTEFLKWTFDDMPTAASVNGLMAVSCHHAASATANAQTLWLKIGAEYMGPNGIAVAADFSETTIVTNTRVYPIANYAGATPDTAWNETIVNQIQAEWFATDNNPDAYLDGVCLEVDYVEGSSDQTISNVAGVTVTITPGTGTVQAHQSIANVTGPTVTVSTGTPQIAQVVEASAFLGLADTAGDFATMTTLEADLYVTEDGTQVDDSLDLYVQVFASDESTPLTDEELAYSHGDTPGPINVPFSGVVAGDKTTWDGARLRLRWSNLIVGTDDLLDVQVHAVEISGTYAAAAQTITPSGPTVTITPGVPSLARTIAPAGPTVTVTPGTPSVLAHQSIGPATGVTITVTPGVPALRLNVGPATGVTVTTTPGTPAFALQLGPATGPTVTVTPGTGTVSLSGGLQSIGPATGVTVSVTPGLPTVVAHQAVGPATGATVTVTAGTGRVGPPVGQLAGVTVTTTPGSPAFARTVGPATGVTVTVTPGVGTVTPGVRNLGPADGVTVTVTPGVAAVGGAQAIAATGVTVSVTPGSPILPQYLTGVVGPTVTVTPGVPSVARTIAPAGPTITVTPGTPTVSVAQTIPAVGVTVSVTPGTPLFAGIQPVGPVAGPTVTVTPGTLALTHDPQGDRERFVAALDLTEPVELLVGTATPPHLLAWPWIGLDQ